MAAEARELIGDRPKISLKLSFALERSIRAATRGASPGERATDEIERCLDLAIAMFEEGGRDAPDQVQPLVRLQPLMRNYQSLMSFDAAIENSPDDVDSLWQRSEVLRRLGYASRADEDWQHAAQLVAAALA